MLLHIYRQLEGNVVMLRYRIYLVAQYSGFYVDFCIVMVVFFAMTLLWPGCAFVFSVSRLTNEIAVY